MLRLSEICTRYEYSSYETHLRVQDHSSIKSADAKCERGRGDGPLSSVSTVEWSQTQSRMVFVELPDPSKGTDRCIPDR